MIGSTSNYPVSIDELFNVYDEVYACVAIPGEIQSIPDDGVYRISLKHMAKTDSFTIPGYSRVAAGATLNSKEFKEVSFAVPTLTQTGIDYAVGYILEFYSGDAGNEVTIDYLCPGDKIKAEYFNYLIDAVYNIQVAIGTMGQNKDLELGTLSNLAKKVGQLATLLKTHIHSGGIETSDAYTTKLTEASFASAVFGNENIRSDAEIAQSKLEKGIKASGSSSIPAGTAFSVDITNTNYDHTNGDRVRLFRGVKGSTDSGEVGSLAHDPANSIDGRFRVKFYTSAGTVVTGIPFFWEIYSII
jgi:hypothetical protein